MIYLEDYDLPVIALNVNMFILISIYLLGGIVQNVCLVSDIGYWNMANLTFSITALLTAISTAICVAVDIWWISKKTHDNLRWL
jgi:hypothetical protein